MKISVRNLGIIKDEAHLDLKPLTIFIGPNNSGKTWLAYTLAGIFGSVGYEAYLTIVQSERLLAIYPSISDAVDEVLGTGTAKFDIRQFAENFAELYFNEIADHIRGWLPEYLGTYLVNFDALKLSISLGEGKTQYIQNIIEADWQMNIGIVTSSEASGINKPNARLSVHKKTNQTDLYMYTSSEGTLLEQLSSDIIKERLIRSILHIIHSALYPNVAILPTERTTFVTFPFNDVKKQTMTQEDLLSKGQNQNEQYVHSLTFPVSDYLNSAIRASQLNPSAKSRRERNAQPAIRRYAYLSRLLEEHILNGKVDFSLPEPNPARKLIFQPAGENEAIEISATSSMVKELTPLVFYLRYFAQPGELLVIDEPEMNLHPRAQAQMIEFLAMLIDAGLHILITTHSPYMLDHLNNLFIAHEHSDKESIRSLFFLKDSQAFIAKDKAAVYLINQGKIKDMLLENDDDEDDDWDTFGKVSDQISDIYFQL